MPSSSSGRRRWPALPDRDVRTLMERPLPLAQRGRGDEAQSADPYPRPGRRNPADRPDDVVMAPIFDQQLMQKLSPWLGLSKRSMGAERRHQEIVDADLLDE